MMALLPEMEKQAVNPDSIIQFIFRPLTHSIVVGLLGLLVAGGSAAEEIPPFPRISSATAAAHPEFPQRLNALIKERDTLRARTQIHNGQCQSVDVGSPAEARCSAALAALGADIDRHIQASTQFIQDYNAVETARIIKDMNALAKRLGWSADKQARLDKALHKLDSDGDPNATGTQIRQTWQDVLARGQSGDMAREASQGEGPGFPGAGEQTRYEDCTIFALANATGQPYGVVAARAGKLIHEGDWREVAERANPQKVIEQQGLDGGEVIMLAEAFGRAEVVPSSDFAKTLKAGHPLLVGVFPENGDVNRGHEVVLTKAFQHGGETWYEMMDSNQGPQRRLYLSAKELNTMLQENGVAFRPEPGTTPKLLRTPVPGGT